MKYSESGEGQVSEWNEAMFKMKRLHELQTEINRVKMNLLARHPMTGQWNYEVWFNSIMALYSEGEPKYSDDEKSEVRNIQKVIEKLFKYSPPHKVRKNNTYSGAKTKDVFETDNWQTIKELLEILESKVRLYNDVHGLSTKNAESMDGRSILR